MKRFTYIAAAAMTVSGLGFIGCDRDDDVRVDTTTAEPTAGERVDSTLDRTGNAVDRGLDRTGDVAGNAVDATGRAVDNTVDATGRAVGDTVNAADRNGTVAPNGTAMAPDAEGIRDVLAQTAEASLTKGGFDDLVERLVDADRNRIGKDGFAEQDMPELDGIIAAIQQQWQAKYNTEFDIKNEEIVYANYRIMQGEIGQAGLAGDRINVSGDVNRQGDVRVNVDNNTGVDMPAAGNNAADANRNDPGRNTATISVPAAGTTPALTVPLIHEAPDSWKIDVPNTLDGPKLQANLSKHLTMVKDSSAQWPADVNEAYRVVSHHVLMALLDK